MNTVHNTVYTSRVTNWPLFWLVDILAIPLLALSGFPHTGVPAVLAAVVVLLLVNTMLTSLRTTVGPNGVVARFGLFGLPRVRYPIATIARGEAATVPVHRMGGWGVHWTPWRGTRITVRSGPILQLLLTNGRRVAISVADPQAAVAVLDTQRSREPR